MPHLVSAWSSSSPKRAAGKTEATLWRFARMYEAGLVDGLYFALPTRAAAVQIHGRIKGFVASLFPDQHRPPVVLAVPGYEPDEDAQEAALQWYKVWWDRHYDNERPWASENPKRYLAAGRSPSAPWTRR